MGIRSARDYSRALAAALRFVALAYVSHARTPTSLVTLHLFDGVMPARMCVVLNAVLALVAFETARYRVEPEYALVAALHAAFALRALLDVACVDSPSCDDDGEHARAR